MINPFVKQSNTPFRANKLVATGSLAGTAGTLGGATLGGATGYLGGGLYNMLRPYIPEETPEEKKYRENRNRLRAAIVGSILGGTIGGVNTAKTYLNLPIDLDAYVQ